MKERPILFSGPMVRAILEDRKGVTRRVVKPQPKVPHHGFAPAWGTSPDGCEFGDKWVWREAGPDYPDGSKDEFRCPYGQPGDRLWVRERMQVTGRIPIMGRAKRIRVWYEADGVRSAHLAYPERLRHDPEIGRCLPYGGYREASRILLDVLDVRVERLQEIDHTDAEREGVEPDEPGFSAVPPFARLWNEINAKRGYPWESNPWVWRIAFRRVQIA